MRADEKIFQARCAARADYAIARYFRAGFAAPPQGDATIAEILDSPSRSAGTVVMLTQWRAIPKSAGAKRCASFTCTAGAAAKRYIFLLDADYRPNFRLKRAASDKLLMPLLAFVDDARRHRSRAGRAATRPARMKPSPRQHAGARQCSFRALPTFHWLHALLLSGLLQPQWQAAGAGAADSSFMPPATIQYADAQYQAIIL